MSLTLLLIICLLTLGSSQSLPSGCTVLTHPPNRLVCAEADLSDPSAFSPIPASDAREHVQIKHVSVTNCRTSADLQFLRQRQFRNLSSLYINNAQGLANITAETFMSVLRDLRELSISNTRSLTSIDSIVSAAALAKMKFNSLRSLTISNCGLVSINHAVFRDLPNLENLVLSGNRLEALNFEDIELNDLLTLDASYNRIVELEIAGWRSFNQLTKFVMSSNSLTDTRILTKLPPSVEVIDLSYNQIAAISLNPSASGSTHNLRELHLNNNRITDIPPLAANGRKKLKYLSLSGNTNLQLTNFLFNLQELEVLHISGCNLQSIEGQLRSLFGLRHLDLSDNLISHTQPGWLSDATLIEKVTLKNNRFSQLHFCNEDDTDCLPALNTLILDGNQFRQLAELSRLSSLQLLSISNNSLLDYDVCVDEGTNSLNELSAICASGRSCEYYMFLELLRQNGQTVYNSHECCNNFSKINPACRLSSPVLYSSYPAACPTKEELCSPRSNNDSISIEPVLGTKVTPSTYSRAAFSELQTGEVTVGILGYVLLLLMVMVIVILWWRNNSYNNWLKSMDWERRASRDHLFSDSEVGRYNNGCADSPNVSLDSTDSPLNQHTLSTQKKSGSHGSLYSTIDGNCVSADASPVTFGGRKKFQHHCSKSPAFSAERYETKFNTTISPRPPASPSSLSVYSYAVNTGPRTAPIEAIPWAATLPRGGQSVPASPIILSSDGSTRSDTQSRKIPPVFSFTDSQPSIGSPDARRKRKVYATNKIRQCNRNPGAPSPMMNRRKYNASKIQRRTPASPSTIS